MGEKIRIFDTTLRDGEQMPGVIFTPGQKIELAMLSSEFGTDIIDIMPIVSGSEKETTKKLVDMKLDAEISASCRPIKGDIETALDCDVGRITLFTPLSDLHLEYKLKISREVNLNKALSMVDFAKDHGLTVDFAGEDSTRADTEYLIHFINQLAGKIDIFFVADTLGCLTPFAEHDLIKKIKKETECCIGLHEHNDFSIATATAIAGLKAGAEVFSGTFCGIGERAGNAPIEEVCAALKFFYNADLGVKYEMLTKICRLVSKYSGVEIHPHKPIVGANAFTHESGIHVDGMIKHPRTYQNIDAELVGQRTRFLFGKHSGKSLLRYTLKKHDIIRKERELDALLKKIKTTSESRKGSLSEEEILTICEQRPVKVVHV